MLDPQQSRASLWWPLAAFVTRERALGRWAYGRGRLARGGYEFLRFGMKQAWACLFGEAVGMSPRVAALQALFTRAGIASRVPEDMRRELWWKFMLNVGVNQLSAILRAPYGVFQRSEDMRELVRSAARWCGWERNWACRRR